MFSTDQISLSATSTRYLGKIGSQINKTPILSSVWIPNSYFLVIIKLTGDQDDTSQEYPRSEDRYNRIKANYV